MEKKEIHSIPVLYTRGTHYQVGYNVGKTFGRLINDFLNDLDFYNKNTLPFYQRPEGQKIYENVMRICLFQYPQYVVEIQGMADGAGLPFQKLFILHIEPLMIVTATSTPSNPNFLSDARISNFSNRPGGNISNPMSMVVSASGRLDPTSSQSPSSNVLSNSRIVSNPMSMVASSSGRLDPTSSQSPSSSDVQSNSSIDHGSSDVMCNNGNEGVILGHNQDVYSQFHGRIYIINAEIVDDNGQVLEQFSAVTYPGFLPGCTMGMNDHGMMHSVNTVNPKTRNPNGTPREFLARAILKAKTIEEVIQIVKNPGCGIADGFNLNIHFANKSGPKILYTIEIGQAQNDKKESELNILEIPVGDSYFHCNRFLRLPIEHAPNSSTGFRHDTLSSSQKARSLDDVKSQLSDTSNSNWPVYRTANVPDKARTVMTGIFNTSDKSWYIYTGPSATTNPVAVLKLNCQ